MSALRKTQDMPSPRFHLHFNFIGAFGGDCPSKAFRTLRNHGKVGRKGSTSGACSRAFNRLLSSHVGKAHFPLHDICFLPVSLQCSSTFRIGPSKMYLSSQPWVQESLGVPPPTFLRGREGGQAKMINLLSWKKEKPLDGITAKDRGALPGEGDGSTQVSWREKRKEEAQRGWEADQKTSEVSSPTSGGDFHAVPSPQLSLVYNTFQDLREDITCLGGVCCNWFNVVVTLRRRALFPVSTKRSGESDGGEANTRKWRQHAGGRGVTPRWVPASWGKLSPSPLTVLSLQLCTQTSLFLDAESWQMGSKEELVIHYMKWNKPAWKAKFCTIPLTRGTQSSQSHGQEGEGWCQRLK